MPEKDEDWFDEKTMSFKNMIYNWIRDVEHEKKKNNYQPNQEMELPSILPAESH